MIGPFLRKYATEATIDLTLYAIDGTALAPGCTFEAGDLKVMIDEGDEANATNLPTDEGQTYSLVITLAQMTGKRIKLILVDQTSPQEWLDTTIIIETYGHASAQHPFDLGTGMSAVNIGAAVGAHADVIAMVKAAVNERIITGAVTDQELLAAICARLVTPPT